MKKIWLSWSTGKDSALTLNRLLDDKSVNVEALVTTVTKDFDRVSMHSTRVRLLELQAQNLDIPLLKVNIPKLCNNNIYEEKFKSILEKADHNKVDFMAFGDLFLEDVRKYREKQFANSKIKPIFPIWKIPTKIASQQIIKLGFKAFVTCIDPKVLPRSFAGREYNKQFLEDLPESVDPCGEGGEFHTFVFDGPIFKNPIKCFVGEIIEKDGFVFADILSDDLACSYSRVANNYADEIFDELDSKPKDREILNHFTELVGPNVRVCDLGCGPGQVAKYLKTKGLNSFGIDISPGMIAKATELNPQIKFEVGDILALSLPDHSVKGIVAFYSLIHFSYSELPKAFEEIKRVLVKGGTLLFSFHIGSDTVHLDDWWDHKVNLDFHFFEPGQIEKIVLDCGFKVLENIERPPYSKDIEHQSHRAYFLIET